MAAGEEPESLDKEFLRLWIAARCDPYNEPVPEIPAATLIAFSDKYIKLFETVTGLTFDGPADGRSVRARIEQNLRAAFPEYFPG